MRSQEIQLVLNRELAAIKLHTPDGSAGALYRIPALSRIRRVRPSKMSGMVEIEWQRETYAVFEEDLENRAAAAGDAHRVLQRLTA